MTQSTMRFKWCGNSRKSDRSRYCMIKNVETPRLSSSTNNLFRHKIPKETKFREESQVNLLTDIKLKEKLGNLRRMTKGEMEWEKLCLIQVHMIVTHLP